jgi:hypothetical protein
MSGAHQILATIGASAPLAVADVFSVDLFNGSTGVGVPITNGINFAARGGSIWGFCRTTAADSWTSLYSNGTGSPPNRFVPSSTNGPPGSGNLLYASTGYTVPAITTTGQTYIGYALAKSVKFYDLVNYTGNGANRSIAHSLGVAPGLILVKRNDFTPASDWAVYHASISNTNRLKINTTAAATTDATVWNSTTADASNFSVGTHADVNTNTGGYTAFLFAHDPDTVNGIIQCGSYTGNGSATGPTVTLGWEPQFLLVKNSTGTGDWLVYDNLRDTANPRTFTMSANTTAIEATAGPDIDFNTTGFQIKSTATSVNTTSSVYLYMAIRKP